MKLFKGGVGSAFLWAMSHFPGHSCSVDGWLVMLGFAIHDDIGFRVWNGNTFWDFSLETFLESWNTGILEIVGVSLFVRMMDGEVLGHPIVEVRENDQDIYSSEKKLINDDYTKTMWAALTLLIID